MSFDKYVVVDVETPNKNMCSICQIGLIEVINGKVVWKFSSLVNPEDEFEDFCVRIHGITPEMAASAPNFGELWKHIEPHWNGHVVVAHNAKFDVGVIARALRKYGVYLQDVRYLCTVELARRILGGRHAGTAIHHGFGLKNLCGRFGLEMDHHHDAMSDTENCFGVLQKLMVLGDIDEENDISVFRLPGIPGLPLEYKEIGAEQTSYCLTGKFRYGAKRSVEDLIRSSGGIVFQSVRKCTDYLVRGELTSGEGKSSKEIAAINMASLGYPVQVISEDKLINVLKGRAS